MWLIDEYLTEPRSDNSAPQERAYRDNTDPREFNELKNFNQRWSGFFVPPLTSFYTFSVLSDDHSRLYVSTSMDREDMQLLAFSNIHTSGQWDLFETQTSAPVMMEQGQYYYMEAYSNQGDGEGVGQWERHSKSMEEKGRLTCSPSPSPKVPGISGSALRSTPCPTPHTHTLETGRARGLSPAPPSPWKHT